MKLKAYLADQGVTQKDFAELLGINERYMSRLVNGHLMPGKRLERDINSLTGGQVKLEAKMK
ncbi:HTH_XRE domain containing protein [uncultured Caudovirales phage]|uniref:HTH_XRE domain containing protein n=1 Tax=uncultured Caudovirales phage TaxID=2100421 RepID=A0A6J5LGW2_9CAUD|nr:HTH_XRE domain containing protein [uncultured Caudovirales phage]